MAWRAAIFQKPHCRGSTQSNDTGEGEGGSKPLLMTRRITTPDIAGNNDNNNGKDHI